MSVETGSGGNGVDTGRETVAAVDEIDGRPHLVVADIARDDAWIAVTESGGLALDEWA
jgi:hypothetical protein